MKRYSLLLGFMALVVMSCTSSSDTCETTQDCFLGETCIDSQCVPESSSNAPTGSNHDAGPDDVDTGEELDVRQPVNDGGRDGQSTPPADGDTSTPDISSGTPDSGTPDIGVEVPLQCVAPFENECVKRENDMRIWPTRSHAISPSIPDSGAGCVFRPDEFIRFEAQGLEATFCESDRAAWFRLTVSQCSYGSDGPNPPTHAELRISLLDCPVDMIGFNVFRGGVEQPCDGESVICTTEGQDLVFRFLVPTGGNSYLFHVGIHSLVDGARFDYDVHYRVWQ